MPDLWHGQMRLERLLSPLPSSDWSLSIVGLNRAEKLGELIRALQREPDPSGGGKQIASGFAYWGVQPTLAWLDACKDPIYPVMQRGIDTFENRWKAIRTELGEPPILHYVSLGTGSGEKDCTILRDLLPTSPELCFLPIDMSAEMLRVGLKPLKGLRLPLGRQMLPVQLDFSDPSDLLELRAGLDATLGTEPILFSLLGNTLANFDDDADLLRMLTDTLMRTDDRLIIEVATTSRIDQQLADCAATEYSGTGRFRDWVTSSLRHFTDLRPHSTAVKYFGTIEDDHALRVTVIYRNTLGVDLDIQLPNGEVTTFPINDSIRLDLTRKYSEDSLLRMCSEVGVSALAHKHEDIGPAKDSRDVVRGRFGIDLVLLRGGKHDVTISDQIWSKPHAG